MNGGPILEIDNLSRRFGGLIANNNISLEVDSGSIVGLIGPNGAGKSTLFNLVAGAYQPSSGTITFNGRNVTRMPAAERCHAGIARTFQVPRSFEHMSVLENVAVGAFVQHEKAHDALSCAAETLEFVDLLHRAQQSAQQLSPPEKRRLEVARALATGPKLLLLDEVMTGLTPSEAQGGVALIRKIRERGITVLMVEHVMEIVMPLVDVAIVLNLGEILTKGAPSEVVKDDRVIMAYLGERYRA